METRVPADIKGVTAKARGDTLLSEFYAPPANQRQNFTLDFALSFLTKQSKLKGCKIGEAC